MGWQMDSAIMAASMKKLSVMMCELLRGRTGHEHTPTHLHMQWLSSHSYGTWVDSCKCIAFFMMLFHPPKCNHTALDVVQEGGDLP